MSAHGPSRPLCVAQLLPALEQGGVERGTLEVAAALVDRGHRALVVSAGGRMVRTLEAMSARHVNMPIGAKSPLALRFVRPLRRLIERENVDILHARSRLPAWIAYLAWRGMAEQKRPRFLTTVHGLYSVNAYSAVMTRGERVIAVSEAVRAYLVQSYPGMDRERIEVIHRGVDDSVFYPHYAPSPQWLERFRAEFPETEDRFMVTIAGRLSRIKGHEDFLDLIDGLVKRDVPVHGLVVGGGPARRRYEDELKAMARERRLPISFAGSRDDLRDIFAVSGAVVSLSTKPESFGRTVLEALALGVPAVGYAHGGVGEILHAMYPGGAVAVGDIEATADAVERIFKTGARVERPNAFPLSRMLDATIRLYEHLAEMH